MRKNSKHNKFDILVENLIQEFLKIPNFDLTQNDETAKLAFNTIVFRIAEITSYKELICNHFIPATNKAIFDSRQLIIQSKYKTFLNAQSLNFDETLYDTIRLAYVGLFHKIESFINDVIKTVDLLYKTDNSSTESIAQWVKRKYKVDFRDWKQNLIIYKINWVCNCVKHKDGYPLKEPKPLGFGYYPENERICIKPDEFKKDCDLLLKLYPGIIQLIMLFGLCRSSIESYDDSDIPEFQKIKEDMIEKMEGTIQTVTKMLEEMRVDKFLAD